MRTLVRTHRNTPTTTNFFDDFFVRDFFGFPNAESKSPKTIPAVNVKETEHEFIVDVAIPGVKKEDVKVELNENVLTISSPNKHRPYTTIAVIQKIIKTLRIQNFDLREELETIFNRYPFAKNHMHQAGFPTNWSTDPLWVKKWKNPPIFILTTFKLNMMTNR